MYKTIYEISTKMDMEFLYFFILGICGVSIAVFMWHTRNALRNKGVKSTTFTIVRCILVFVTSMGLASAGIILFCFHIKENKMLVGAYKEQRYQIAEGYVKVQHEQPSGGHDKGDIILVGNTKFIINYFIVTDAYKNTIAHGGALKEGVYARVYHYHGKILRVDIRQDDKDKKINENFDSPNSIIIGNDIETGTY